jgi:hypothetical protein
MISTWIFFFRQNLLNQLHNFRIFYDTRPALTIAAVAAYELKPDDELLMVVQIVLKQLPTI